MRVTMQRVFIHGRVFTGSLPLQEAFLTEDNYFKAAGTDDEILALADPAAECVDLAGKFVTPGFNDSHMHLLGFGQSLKLLQLAEHTASLRDLLETVRTHIQNNPPRKGQWIRGRGWNQDYFTDIHRMPQRADLDEISSEIPIVLTRACGHVCTANSAALQAAGITADTVSPEGGEIGMQDGEPNGILYDNAITLLDRVIPAPDLQEIKEMILLACHALNTYGITSCQTDDYSMSRAVSPYLINQAYEELAAEGKLTVRINEQCNLTDPEDLKVFCEKGNITGKGNAFFRIGPLKLLGDGSLGGRSAYLSIPYADDSSTRGFPLFSETELRTLISYANRVGMQIAVHAIGDACLDMILDAFELALQECPRDDHRHGIVHCQITRPDQLERIQRLHLHIYAQSIFLDYDNHIVEQRCGKELAASSYSWKTLLDNGVTVSNGSDCPVERPDVMEGIELAVTRTSLDGTGPYLPEQAFTVEEALQSFTASAAKASFEENCKGQIKAGYLADFTVLAENPFETDVHKLHGIQPLSVWLNGKCIYTK